MMGHDGRAPTSRRVSIVALMSALALVGMYVLSPVPNVELGTVVLFTTAYVFGLQVGVLCVVIVSVVYGTLNPWGAMIPQILVTQVGGWLFTVGTGHIAGQGRGLNDTVENSGSSTTELAALGLTTTVFYDLLTNIGFSWAFSVPYPVALAAGLPFMVVHVVSNTVLFPGVVPRVSRAISEVLMVTGRSDGTGMCGRCEE